jgi:hypothetical protein
MVGECLAEYFIRRCDASHPGWLPRQFDGASLNGDEPELAQALDRCEVMDDHTADQAGNMLQPVSKYFKKNVGRQRLKGTTPWGLVEGAPDASLLGSLWAEVQKEWQ